MTTPTDDALARVEAALEKMTPDPWRTDGAHGLFVQHHELHIADLELSNATDNERRQRGNAQGIVTIRNDTPALCQELRRLREENAELKDAARCKTVRTIVRPVPKFEEPTP